MKWILLDFVMEIVCSLFIFSEIQNAYTNQRDNIIDLWRKLDKYESTVSSQNTVSTIWSYLDLTRRKMFSMKPKDAVMAQRLEFLDIYFRTFFLAAAVLVFVFLFCKIVFRLYRSSKPDKITAINKPPLFNSQTNVN